MLEFLDKVDSNQMIEFTNFNNWFYGTSYDSLDENKINVGVFNPAGIESLLKCNNVEVDVYYISALPKDRLIRQLNRETNVDIDEILRRYEADKRDFANLDFKYTIIPNEAYKDLVSGPLEILTQAQRKGWLRTKKTN